MPPKPVSNVDGISRPFAPLSPPREPSRINIQPAINQSVAAPTSAPQPQVEVRHKVSSSKPNNTAVIAIVVTLIVMAILIGLAYFAYTKSK